MKLRDFGQLLCLAIIIAIWCTPITISIFTGNWWFIFLYAVWLLPATLFTVLIVTIWDNIK